jgi:GlcNAc-P-P-Und epimerase
MKTFINKNCVIFGGAGFIGSHFALYLLSNKLVENIYLFDLEPMRPFFGMNDSRVHYVYGDARNSINKNLLPKDISIIVNFAAIHREPGHKSNEYFNTNILGAENITEFAEKVYCDRIIFTSSISPYGIEDKLKDEHTIPCPNTPYGSSKLVAEKIHTAWQNRDTKKRILTIVRPGVVFGKGEGGNMSRLVKLIHKNFFFYMGNKDTRKAGIYVKELVNQILWVHQRQIKNKFPKITLFNATMWPNPSISDYVFNVKSVANLKSYVPNLPYSFLMCFGFIFELIFKIIGKSNPFSPVRLRKLIRPNLVKPFFLSKHKYKPIYTLRSALKDWKKEDPEVWS